MLRACVPKGVVCRVSGQQNKTHGIGIHAPTTAIRRSNNADDISHAPYRHRLQTCVHFMHGDENAMDAKPAATTADSVPDSLDVAFQRAHGAMHEVYTLKARPHDLQQWQTTLSSLAAYCDLVLTPMLAVHGHHVTQRKTQRMQAQLALPQQEVTDSQQCMSGSSLQSTSSQPSNQPATINTSSSSTHGAQLAQDLHDPQAPQAPGSTSSTEPWLHVLSLSHMVFLLAPVMELINELALLLPRTDLQTASDMGSGVPASQHQQNQPGVAHATLRAVTALPEAQELTRALSGLLMVRPDQLGAIRAWNGTEDCLYILETWVCTAGIVLLVTEMQAAHTGEAAVQAAPVLRHLDIPSLAIQASVLHSPVTPYGPFRLHALTFTHRWGIFRRELELHTAIPKQQANTSPDHCSSDVYHATPEPHPQGSQGEANPNDHSKSTQPSLERMSLRRYSSVVVLEQWTARLLDILKGGLMAVPAEDVGVIGDLIWCAAHVLPPLPRPWLAELLDALLLLNHVHWAEGQLQELLRSVGRLKREAPAGATQYQTAVATAAAAAAAAAASGQAKHVHNWWLRDVLPNDPAPSSTDFTSLDKRLDRLEQSVVAGAGHMLLSPCPGDPLSSSCSTEEYQQLLRALNTEVGARLAAHMGKQ